MTSWQIISGYGNSFRWEITGQDFGAEPEDERSDFPQSHVQKAYNSSSRLSSMTDLLLQGCSKLLEDDNDEDVEKTPLFKTGLGRFVPVKQSSITKALSVLGDDSVTDTGQIQARDNVCDFPNSLFQTGSGKKVNISSDGLARAKTLLGLVEESDPCNFQGFRNSRKSSNIDSSFGWPNISNFEKGEGVNHFGTVHSASGPRSSPICRTDIGHSRFGNEAKQPTHSRMPNSATTPSPIKFQTAGGRSISVSSDALQHARSLLGDPELGTLLDTGNADDLELPFSKNKGLDNSSSNKENDPRSCLSHQEMAKSKLMSKSFISPMRSSSKRMHSSGNSQIINSGINLIRQFDEVSQDDVCRLSRNLTCQQERSSNGLCVPNTMVDNSLANGIDLRKNLVGRSPSRQLVDISNTIGTAAANNRQATNEKRRIIRTSVSPFKKPRSSKFYTPVKSNFSFVPSGSSNFSPEHCCSKGRVSTRYPFPGTRIYVKEYFGVPPLDHNKLAHSSDQYRWIRSGNAESYTFPDDSGVRYIGAEDFFHMLIRSGASEQYASKEWVKNHYRWIIWKLACYERCYPTKAAGKILSVSNVLEELKYRYEREVNHGHRSAIKRILEGDASPNSMMVLCISAICLNYEHKLEVSSFAQGDAENHTAAAAKVELTDGWYSIDALLDVLLLKQLASGKLFVGQKLRIWGAGLSGWIAPVSPLEVPRTVNLMLHINGTYRAHWADRLGFCKGVGVPLAFKCIKSNGGPVPLTLVGITRIYPLLYKERLSDGRSIVRSERLETKVVQSYNERRSVIIESIVSDFQRGTKYSHIYNDSDSEDGAKIWKILEKASQPEVLLAEMSPDQISSFAKYQANMEAIRQSDMEKSIEKALENAGLGKREVIPFMRLRVVGLTSKTYQGKDSPKEGLTTIWNPTEKQQSELIEGKAYNVSGLMPVSADPDTIYLQARATSWKPLSLQAVEHFTPFFTPCKSVPLSNFGAVPLSREFDIAAFVVYVGEVYKDAHQKKQWVFVTDSSITELQSKEFSDCLLAICFCSPCMDDESFVPFNFNLEGSTVGFRNLIKRAKDQVNRLWVAEASENSTYFLSFDTPHSSHLKNAAVSAQRWGTFSHLIVDKLKEKILFIIGDGKA
ncbi:protein BREAST CANCER SUSCEPTIBILITY 2 homolog B [Morus notabilis]|uniref:protein BREAST CANCER SUSCEPTIBILITY 2 homolog B n=1 Tax=Morus notabilis TaxID=981085 RepID=UPI000CECF9AC|nr:protein BREAST CANCER SUSCEPTIBILITY 2 homolog B [Morus notabilis]